MNYNLYISPDFIVFLFGLCIGSFLNVCIYRMPKEKLSINNPKRSICTACGEQLHFLENIPLLSFIFLGGKCRSCKTSISLRYPIVELISACFAVAVFLKFGFTLSGLIYFCFLSSLVVITFIDLDYQIIPNTISLPGIIIGFIASFQLPGMSVQESLLGIAFGGGVFYLIAYIFVKIRGIDGMGMGDVKLLAMLGAFLGLKGVLFIIFISSVIGTLSGILVMIQSRSFTLQQKIPFGPFLSIAAMLYVFWGEKLILYYVLWLRGG
ncbi:peptidase A24 [Candidatus Magnetomorum sp. HK-1]|nr:peptidase A24 [Candidatus Magnetomorum sp. HK-1]